MRKPTLLPLSDKEIAARYESGQTLAALAACCGVSVGPIRRVLLKTGSTFRKPGGPKGERPNNKVTRVCKGLDCSNIFQVYASANKKYCQPSCRYACPELRELLRSNYEGLHTIRNVDVTTKTADCGACGHTEVRLRSGGTKSRTKSWRCRTAERARDIARRYGLSMQDVASMLFKQNGTCGICSLNKPLFIDHDHTSGAVRGLLCRGCNTGIGSLGDSASTLRAAACYLEQHVSS